MTALSKKLAADPSHLILSQYGKEEKASELPVPFCCPAAAGVRTVYAAHGDYGSGLRTPPSWRTVSPHRYLGTSSHPASFCPFCGKGLPRLIRRASLPVPICVPSEDGSHCATCGARSQSCDCFPPECAWEAEGAPPVFAAVCLLQRTILGPWQDFAPGSRRIVFLSVSRKGRPSEKGLPGGRVEEGESPEDAARRELLEETGFVAGPMHKVFDAVDDAGVRVVCFRAQTFSETPVPPGAGESGTVEWVSMSDLVQSSPFSSFNSSLFELLGMRC